MTHTKKKISDVMSSPQDIARARHAKELEPLHDAWTSWVKTREVRCIFARLAMRHVVHNDLSSL